MPNTNINLARVELTPTGSFRIIAIDEASTFVEARAPLTPEEQSLIDEFNAREAMRALVHETASNPVNPSAAVRNHMYTNFRDATRHHQAWFHREFGRYPLHFTIEKFLNANKLPNDWKALLLEWPHVSVNDPARVAYTRSPEHGEADRQTVTSLGKYLRRHFNVPDHEIRDACAQAKGGVVHITRDMDRMIWAVQNGPSSCMQDDDWDDRSHPYNVYDPSHGWALAYRVEVDADGDEQCVARALVYEDGDDKCFVRTYRKSTGYSYSDEGMEATLREMGYENVSGWPDGARLARLERWGDIVLPYIDGCNQRVADRGSYLEIDDYGHLSGENTNGLASREHAGSCDRCDEDIDDEDDLHTVGRPDEEVTVCEHCRDYHYTYVLGHNRMRYYVEDDDVVETNCGDDVDREAMDELDVVETNNGDYAYAENCVRASNDEWYDEDDLDSEGIVELARAYDGYRFAPEHDCTETREGHFYHDDDLHDVHWLDSESEWVHEDDLSDEERIELGLPIPMVTADGQLKLPIYRVPDSLPLALPAPSNKPFYTFR